MTCPYSRHGYGKGQLAKEYHQNSVSAIGLFKYGTDVGKCHFSASTIRAGKQRSLGCVQGSQSVDTILRAGRGVGGLDQSHAPLL